MYNISGQSFALLFCSKKKNRHTRLNVTAFRKEYQMISAFSRWLYITTQEVFDSITFCFKNYISDDVGSFRLFHAAIAGFSSSSTLGLFVANTGPIDPHPSQDMDRIVIPLSWLENFLGFVFEPQNGHASSSAIVFPLSCSARHRVLLLV